MVPENLWGCFVCTSDRAGPSDCENYEKNGAKRGLTIIFTDMKMAFCGFAFFSDFSFLLKKRERSKKRVKLFAFGKRLCKLSFLDKSGENSKLKREKTQNYLAFRRCSRLLKVRLFRSYKKLRFFNLQKKKKQMVITPKLKTQAYDTE